MLSELNPAFELPPEERIMAAIYGKVLTRSNWLREGILEILALMATLSPDISFHANRSGEDVARLKKRYKDLTVYSIRFPIIESFLIPIGRCQSKIFSDSKQY